MLPFTNLSPDPDQEYFADGISEELMNALTRIDELQVAGRTSSFYFKNREESLQDISEQLGVAHILEGSVRKAGNDLRINARLTNARSGFQLWSETFDRTLDDVFAIQEEIATAVAEALQITLGVGDLGNQPGMTRNVEAYDLYLQGKNLLRGDSVQLLPERIDALERAVELDPDFAIAWATLAQGYDWIRIRRLNTSADSSLIQQQREAIARARELAPDSPGVLSSAAFLEDDGLLEKERLHRQAMDFNNAPMPGLGVFLISVGKVEEAIIHLEAYFRREPVVIGPSNILGLSYASAGRLEEALAELDRGDSIGEPQNNLRFHMVQIALGNGDRDLIEQRLDLQLALENSQAGYVHSAMRPFLDEPDSAIAELQRLREDPEVDGNLIRMEALQSWAAYFNEPEWALGVARALAIGVEETASNPVHTWLRVFSDMRKLPGFKDLMRDLGLVDYWRATGWGDFCRPVNDDDFECE